jgi:hypothetical protein
MSIFFAYIRNRKTSLIIPTSLGVGGRFWNGAANWQFALTNPKKPIGAGVLGGLLNAERDAT